MMPAILQVIGYQNSGKTLFIERLISRASEAGVKVGVIKHHGHGKPDVYDDEKDTGRHRKAGAIVTGVSGDGLLSIHATSEQDWELPQLINLYSSFDLDVILIEGFKNYHYPRVIMVRDHQDEKLLDSTMIKAVITQASNLPDIEQSYTEANIDDCIDHLLEDLTNGVL
ncbi:molybdopterin-guanine dinucleotide biosynthesis protein B [Guptibacillus algicola]|uniref:molybdopterin-guanine dinucleotide biosynthesis protein B n=1 Tax=Guptibacillus algicola TaxID=225844 RepID=UPI001CD26BA1|nr:molybdopterin-guanine dinucleotide biosynthesis protein B [Alkalihalobacillus algicola]MCA0987789.1 molybdopterin-guanine dinucleotide biosynthesis protein B [Alkalihalobacillus algicola]